MRGKINLQNTGKVNIEEKEILIENCFDFETFLSEFADKDIVEINIRNEKELQIEICVRRLSGTVLFIIDKNSFSEIFKAKGPFTGYQVKCNLGLRYQANKEKVRV